MGQILRYTARQVVSNDLTTDNLAQDAITYPVMFIGRAQDIAEVQKLIHALDEAIQQEEA